MRAAFDLAERLAWNDEPSYSQLSDSERAALDELVEELDLVELDDDLFEPGLQTPEQACERVRVFSERVSGGRAV